MMFETIDEFYKLRERLMENQKKKDKKNDTKKSVVNTYVESIKKLKNEIKENKKLISRKETERSNVGKNPKDTFFGDVMQEMHLVKWPSKLEMVKYTIATLIFVLFFSGFFFLINLLFLLISKIFNQNRKG